MNTKYVLSLLFSIIMILGCQPNNKKKEDTKTTQVEVKTLDSLKHLNDLIDKNPLNDEARYQRAQYHYNHGEYNSALSDMGKAIQLNPDNTTYIIFLSDIYQAINKFEDAKDVLKKVVDNVPENIEAKLKLAKLELAFSNYEQAIINVNRTLKIDPNNADALYLKGYINLEKGNKNNAMIFFRKAIENNPKFVDPYIQLGILHSENKEDVAIDYFNSVLNMKPQDVSTMYLLAMYYQNNNMEKKAISMYENMLSIDPNNAMAHFNIGYIYLVFNEEYENAILKFTEAIEINPNYYQAYYNRGLAYEMLGKKQKAKENYNQALKIKTNFDKAIEGLNRLQ